MVNPTPEEREVALRAERHRAARRYLRAHDVLASPPTDPDSPFLRRQRAYTLGAAGEYRFRVADQLGVLPPAARMPELLETLESAIELDGTIPDLHWDIALAQARYLGDHEAAEAALAHAAELGMQHPMLPHLHEIIEERRLPQPRDDSAGYRLREVFFELIDVTADRVLPEELRFDPACPDRLDSFEDYERAVTSLAASDSCSPDDVHRLVVGLRRLREAGDLTADPLDYALELAFRAAEASADVALAEDVLAELLQYLAEFSFHVSGGEPEPSDVRKARRIARRGLNIAEQTQVPIDPFIHAQLWLAAGQAAGRPADLRLTEALDAYSRALVLLRRAGETADVGRLTQLLERMLAMAARIGIGDLGTVAEVVAAAYEAAKVLGTTEAMLSSGLQYSSLLAGVGQPEPASEVLEELLALPDLSASDRWEVRFELASRASEARRPWDAEALQRALLDEGHDEQSTVAMLWNNYANTLRELGRYEEALASINRALELTPQPDSNEEVPQRLAMLHGNRGQILLVLDRLDEAEADLDRAREITERLPVGEAVYRVHGLLTRLRLRTGEFEQALEHSDKALAELQRGLTKGTPNLSVWESTLAEWSRLDGLGLEARMRGETSPEDAFAFAEAAKGRVLRMLEAYAAGAESEEVFSVGAQRTAIDAVRLWVRDRPATWVVSLACTGQGVALFAIRPDGDVAADWHAGPLYDRFRDTVYDRWESLSAWALDQRLQRAVGQVGAPDDLVLDAASAVSELTLDWLGALLHRSFPGVGEGGNALLIIPHRSLRSLPLAHSRLPNGSYLSEIFEHTSIVPLVADLAGAIGRARDDDTALDAFVDPEGDLPFSRLEGLAGYADHTYVRWEATKSELVALLGRPGRLLVSGHGDFVEHTPWESWLAAADGRLPLLELTGGHAVRRSLVIVSSCESGRSRRSNADEPIGFPKLLLRAGAGAVIAPVWRVDDFATFLVMTRLQELLAEGEAPSRALNRASHWLRRLSADATLTRLDALQQRAEEYAERRSLEPGAMGFARMELDTQRAWLRRAYRGPERPFATPVFWAGFQLTGFAV